MNILAEIRALGCEDRRFFENPPVLENWVGGKAGRPSGSIAIPDPLTGETLFVMPRSGDDDCKAVIEYFVREFPLGTDAIWPLEKRGETFQRAAALLKEKYWGKFLAAIRSCMPKSHAEAEGELVLSHRFLMSLSPMRCRQLYSPQDGGPGIDYCTYSETRFAPWGPVGLITPYNYPVEIPLLQIAAALACGNVIVVKPHEYAGLATQAIVELLLEAGVPPTFIALIHGYGPEVGRIASDERLRKVVFTGSSVVADQIHSARLAVERSGLNWVYLTDPWIGMEIARVGGSIAKSAFGLSGQRCSSARYVLCSQEWIERGLLDAIGTGARQFHFDDGSLPVLMGGWPATRVHIVFSEMEKFGMKVQWGGELISAFTYKRPDTGVDFQNRFHYGAVMPSLWTLSPDILRAERDASAFKGILHTERFFPNLVVIPWRNEDERRLCVDFINSTPDHLTCSIGTPNPADAHELLRKELRANGIVNVGAAPWTTGAEEYKPFGPADPDGACIGGSDFHLRRTWMSPYGFHFAR